MAGLAETTCFEHGSVSRTREQLLRSILQTVGTFGRPVRHGINQLDTNFETRSVDVRVGEVCRGSTAESATGCF